MPIPVSDKHADEYGLVLAAIVAAENEQARENGSD